MLSSSFVVRLATTGALPALTFVGSEATANANGALVIDGVSAAINDLILVANQAIPAQNGIFYVVDAGSGGTPFIIDRYPPALGLQIGNIVYVKEGVTNATRLFVVTSVINMVGSDPSIFGFALSSFVVSQITEQTPGGGVNFLLDLTGINDTSGGIQVNGTRVLRDRLAGIPGYPVPLAAGDPPTQAEFNALVNFVNAMYIGLASNSGSGHGLFEQP